MSKIQPRKLTWTHIWGIAEKFRSLYVDPITRIPIPIEEIIEFKLNINIDPIFGLKEKADIESYLQKDLKTIGIDSKIFTDERYSKRLRFTLAHEVGHLELHSEIIRGIDFKDEDEWIDLYLQNDDEDIDWFEKQANEFAGRLLVPRNKLKTLVEEQKDNITKLIPTIPIDYRYEFITTGLSKKICDNFGVSHEVIYNRIKKEKIYEDLGIDLKNNN